MKKKEKGITRERKRDQGLYTIHVAAELVSVHPQTLRLYERLGLVKPQRTRGKIRLYSDENIDRLQQIQQFTQARRVNLAGVEIILNMLEEMDQMKRQMEEEMEKMHKEMEEEFKNNFL